MFFGGTRCRSISNAILGLQNKMEHSHTHVNIKHVIIKINNITRSLCGQFFPGCHPQVGLLPRYQLVICCGAGVRLRVLVSGSECVNERTENLYRVYQTFGLLDLQDKIHCLSDGTTSNLKLLAMPF